MRCLACGAEMHLIEAKPDETLMFSGHEQHTFECSGCHLHVRRLVSTHEIGPFPEERMRLPPGWLKSQNIGVTDQVTSARALAKVCGWARDSFLTMRHRTVSICITGIGMLITIALAGLLLRWDGPKGPMDQGPAGPKGPTGDPGPPGQESGLRMVRSNCDQASCTAQCGENEMLLTAYCGPKRNVAIPTERTLQRAATRSPRTVLLSPCARGCRLLNHRQAETRPRLQRADKALPPRRRRLRY